MSKVVINPKYQHLSDFIQQLPITFQKEGKLIYDGRNVLKIFDVQGLQVCVKSFRKPNIINKWVYAYFRKSKASRSYEYALKLTNLGIDTPDPIAYIEEKSVVFGRSYYICIYQEYDLTLRELYDCDLEDKEEIFRQFVDFSYTLHQNNVFHIDYSPGNVLIKKEENRYHFSVIDINRMQFKEIDLDLALQNLSKIWADEYMYPIIAEKYAEFYHADYQQVLERYTTLEKTHKKNVFQHRKNKKRWKKLIGKQ